jgi:hypothetical protein
LVAAPWATARIKALAAALLRVNALDSEDIAQIM